MQTDLDILLDSIRPERTVVETFNRANQAINTFRAGSALIDNWQQFKRTMVGFRRHFDLYCLRLSGHVNVPDDYYLSDFTFPVLREIYGTNGEKAAFEMARTGAGGGLYEVLRAVGMHVAEKYAKAEITAKVSVYLENLTVDQQLAASAEYLSRHGHLLPSEMTEASAGRIHDRFNKVLEQHPWLILKIHEVGR